MNKKDIALWGLALFSLLMFFAYVGATSEEEGSQEEEVRTLYEAQNVAMFTTTSSITVDMYAMDGSGDTEDAVQDAHKAHTAAQELDAPNHMSIIDSRLEALTSAYVDAAEQARTCDQRDDTECPRLDPLLDTLNTRIDEYWTEHGEWIRELELNLLDMPYEG